MAATNPVLDAPATRVRRSPLPRRADLAVGLAVALVMIWAIFPLASAVLMSVKAGRDTWEGRVLPWLTFQPTLDNWRKLAALDGLAAAMTTSVWIAVGSATLATVIALPAAYALGRSHFPARWQAAMTAWFVVQRLIPPAALLTSYLLLLRRLNLIDTAAALVLVNAALNLPLAVIVMVGAFRELPKVLEEAAAIDGASRWEAFWRVATPLALPAIAGSWLLCLAFAWNEWMFASAVAYTEARSFPLLVAATGGGGGANMQAASTRALAALIVPVVAAALAQRWTARALSLGAVKG